MMLNHLLYQLYRINNRRIRNAIRKIVYHLEGGEIYSTTLRRMFRDYHGVEIGMYTHGGCFSLTNIAPRMTIGRYCSLAQNIKILTRNHPMDFKSTHAFFFNPALKFCDSYLVDNTPLRIGNDVWMGEYAVILAHVTEIGDGAVIGAGAVVNKNVPPYAVVVGNPARIVRYRFPKEIIDELLASKWWEKDIEEIKPHIEEFQQPYEKLYFDRKATAEAEGATNERHEHHFLRKHEDTDRE